MLGPAPMDRILPTIFAIIRWAIMSSNIVKRRTPYDLHRLTIDNRPVPSTMLSGSKRNASNITGTRLLLIAAIILSYITGLSAALIYVWTIFYCPCKALPP